MLRWLDRIFSKTTEDLSLSEMLQRLKAENDPGEPVELVESIGKLQIPSGRLKIFCYGYEGIEIRAAGIGEVVVAPKIWKYPNGDERIFELIFDFQFNVGTSPPKKIGTVTSESITMLACDSNDFDECWTETGDERVGKISLLPDETVFELLQKRFRLKTKMVDRFSAEIIGPVSQDLESQILDYLGTFPEYCKFPFLHFKVKTSNSWERACDREGCWEFMPISSKYPAEMLSFCPGFGKGTYDAYCSYANNLPARVTISFLDYEKADAN